MLPFVTLAFICGLALGSLIPYYPLSVLIAIGVSAVGLSVLEATRRMVAVGATACFACVLGGILYWMVAVESRSQVAVHEQQPDLFRPCVGRVIAPVQFSPGRMTLIVRCEEEDTGRPLVVRLTWRAPERRLYEGDRISVRARFRPPAGSLNPGGFNYADYLERQGIDAVATVNGLEALELLESGRDSPRWVLWNQVDRWRDTIRLSAQHRLSQPALGLFLGVVIGERGYLDPDVRDQFMITGTVHLLSISGSHLGLVCVLAFTTIRRGLLWLPAPWLLRLSRRITPTRVAAVTTMFPAAAYACLAGAEVATVRSLAMVLVALAAKWLGCQQRMFHGLAAAALGIVLHDPQAIYDISFQLSFLSVCAVAWRLSQTPTVDDEQPLVPSLWSRARQWGLEALAMSALVTVTTIPLVALYFNQVSWLGLLTNVAAVPVMGAILVPLGLLASVGHGLNMGEELPLADAIQWSMDLFVSAVHRLSEIPGAEWHVASPALPGVAAFYACLATMWIRSDRRRTVAIAATGLILLLCWWVWSPRLLPDGDRFRITFLDVSQGDSAVLELPGGEVILIDGGGSYERFDMGRGVVAPYLWNRGIRTIDYVIATHPQLDHVGGLTYVLRHFNVRQFWSTGDVREEAFYQRLQEAVTEGRVPERSVRQREDAVTLGPCRLEVLNPQQGTVADVSSRRGRQGHILNNRSIVTALMCGRHKALFTADVEEEALFRMSREPASVGADLVKVPHHGAASSLDPSWLERVNPRYAVISVGRHNAYGHPASGVVQAYADKGVSVYRTDQDGGIWVTGRCSAPELQIHRTTEQQARRVPFPGCLWTCERSNWVRLINRWNE